MVIKVLYGQADRVGYFLQVLEKKCSPCWQLLPHCTPVLICCPSAIGFLIDDNSLRKYPTLWCSNERLENNLGLPVTSQQPLTSHRGKYFYWKCWEIYEKNWRFLDCIITEGDQDDEAWNCLLLLLWWDEYQVIKFQLETWDERCKGIKHLVQGNTLVCRAEFGFHGKIRLLWVIKQIVPSSVRANLN